MRRSAIIAGAVFAILALVGGMLAYSYTQISVSLAGVEFHSIDWMDLTSSNVLELGGSLLTGDAVGAALDLVDGVNLNLVLGLDNGGFLPVYIPDVAYDLTVNDVFVGQGTSTIDAIINPGQTKRVTTLQNVGKDSLAPAIGAIIRDGGMMDVRARGDAYFTLLGLEIPVPFESSKQISIIDEIKTRLGRYEADTRITLDVYESAVRQGAVVPISGRLTTDGGQALPGMAVQIKDEDTGSGDDHIATVYTDARGQFHYSWTARPMDRSNNVVEIYAVFEGAQGLEQARSRQHDITVDDAGQDTHQQGRTSSRTSLSLSIPNASVEEGDVLQISGRLVDSQGNGLQNSLIYIKDEDTGSGDDHIATVYTDARGQFHYSWTARPMDTFDSVVEIYAVFEGSSGLDGSRSTQINIRVR